MAVTASQAKTNGHLNGDHSTIKVTDDAQRTMKKSRVTETHKASASFTAERSQTINSHEQMTVLIKTVTTTRARLTTELSHVDGHYIDSMCLESFVDYIESERLTHMPRRGSRWDKVLKWAEYFSLQISGYEKAVASFAPECTKAARLIWSACRVLIEVCNEPIVVIDLSYGLLTTFSLGLRMLNQSKLPSRFSTKSGFHCHFFSDTMSCFHITLTSEQKLACRLMTSWKLLET